MSDVDPSLDGPPWEEDVPERDENTDDMFGAPAAAPEPAATPVAVAAPAPAKAEPFADEPAGDGAYQVLARKYRPRAFEDLIGQEAMVRTLTNAFATGRIAHAFMLTGVRGVGKTTTARLLADDLVEGFRPPFPRDDLVTHGRATDCTAARSGLRHISGSA